MATTTDQNGGLNEDESPSSLVAENANPSEKPEKPSEKPNNGDEGSKDNNGGGDGSAAMAVDER